MINSSHAKNYFIVKTTESGIDKYYMDIVLEPNIKLLCSYPEYVSPENLLNINQMTSSAISQEVKIATQITTNPLEAMSSVKIPLGQVPQGTVIDPETYFDVNTFEFEESENTPEIYDLPENFFTHDLVVPKTGKKVIIKKDSMGIAMAIVIIIAIIIIGLLISFLF